MVGRIAATPGVVLIAASGLAGQPVRPGTVQPRRPHRFMGVDHDLVARRLPRHTQIVVDHPLAVMVLAARDDAADVAGLDAVVAVLFHKGKGILHPPLIIGHRRRGLVVHDQAHSVFGGVALQLLHIEIGIGSDKIKNLLFPVTEPVLPADVPALDQHPVKAVSGGEIDVAFGLGRGGAVASVGLESVPVGRGQFEIAGVGHVPGDRADVHAPPDADIFLRLDPAGIGQGAGLVEVEDDPRGEDLPGIAADDDGAPGALLGSLQVGHMTQRIGHQHRAQRKSALVDEQVHRRIVDQSGFEKVDVKPLAGLEHERGLHGIGGDDRAYSDLLHRRAAHGVNLAERGGRIVVFVGIIVTGDPPGQVIAGQIEPGLFTADDEVAQVGLVREFIAKAEAIVEETEADDHLPLLRLIPLQRHRQLAVMAADAPLFAPDRLPALVGGGAPGFDHLEAVEEAGIVLEGDAHPALQNDRLFAEIEAVAGLTRTVEIEFESELAIRRVQFQRGKPQRGDQDRHKDHVFHHRCCSP